MWDRFCGPRLKFNCYQEATIVQFDLVKALRLIFSVNCKEWKMKKKPVWILKNKSEDDERNQNDSEEETLTSGILL